MHAAPESVPAANRSEALPRIVRPGRVCEISREDVRGQQLEVFVNRHRTLGQALRDSRRFGDLEYVVTAKERLTFTEHYDRVAAVSTALRDRYGVGKGDVVVICAANSPEWLVTFWAATNLGAVVVGMNSHWAGPEIEYGLALSQPRLVVADEERRRSMTQVAGEVLSIEDHIPALAREFAGADLPPEPEDLVEDDPAVVLFTSGTTGRPKGATHSHRNVIAAVWFHIVNDEVAREMGRTVPTGRRCLLITPLFHISGLHALGVSRLVTGDTAVMYQGRFEVDRVLRFVEQEAVTHWAAVPTMATRVVEYADRHGLDGYDLSALTTFTFGAAPSSGAVKQRMRELLPQLNTSMSGTYGLTECSSAATYADVADLEADPSSSGRPVPTMEIELRDDRGIAVEDGLEGEIHLRSPLVMLGYWRDPEATAEAISADGWLRTGDLGSWVDGRLRVSARRSSLILRAGENVYPAEVEFALESHEAVCESIVLGVPHPDLGEQVVAIVVVRPDAVVTEAEMVAHMRSRVARYKIPEVWRITTEALPRNATGKVARHLVQFDREPQENLS